MTEPLYLEDMVPGRRFVSPGSVEVDAGEIRAFAQEYDPQPFHLDDEAARGTPFGGLAASGWHTAALTMRLLTAGTLPVAGGIIGMHMEVSWPRPTRPGSRLRLECDVLEARPSRSRPEQGVVKMRCTTLTEAGETAQVLVATLVVPRRGAVDSPLSR